MALPVSRAQVLSNERSLAVGKVAKVDLFRLV